MVKVIKKLNNTGKVKFAKEVHVFNDSFLVEAQVTVVPCHPENSTISNIPYQFIVQGDDFVKVNGENVYYTRDEIEDLLSSSEFKNLILKEIVLKVLS
jgi:hypothetical protein